MEDYNMQNQQQKVVPVVMVTHHPVDEDEINLFGLLQVVLRWRWVVVGVAFLAILISVIYALLGTPIYQAEAVLLPPTISDLDGLKIKSKKDLDPTEAYKALFMHLNSLSVRRNFFEKNRVANQFSMNPKSVHDANAIFKVFNKNLSVSQHDGHIKTMVSFTGPNAHLAAQLVNQFVKYVNQQTTNELVDDARSELQIEIDGVQAQISSLQHMAKQELQMRIEDLRTASDVAKTLGIKAPITTPSVVGGDQPLYMRGYLALNAEVKVLQKRRNRNFGKITPEMRSSLIKLALLKSVHYYPSRMSMMRVDQLALASNQRIKPRRKRIVLIGLVIGLVLGTISAFLADIIVSQRGEIKPEQDAA